jgi:hypothetical protein
MKFPLVANFIKHFGRKLHCHQHSAFSFDWGYAISGVNYAKKSFMKFPPVANFIKHFGHKLYCYQRIALSLD